MPPLRDEPADQRGDHRLRLDVGSRASARRGARLPADDGARAERLAGEDHASCSARQLRALQDERSFRRHVAPSGVAGLTDPPLPLAWPRNKVGGMEFGIAVASPLDSWKVVKRAEELGFSHAWFYDTQMLSPDIFVTMALAAEHTSKIKLGAGVFVPSNRIAPVCANGIASLNRLPSVRIVCGPGPGLTRGTA